MQKKTKHPPIKSHTYVGFARENSRICIYQFSATGEWYVEWYSGEIRCGYETTGTFEEAWEKADEVIAKNLFIKIVEALR